MDNKFLSSVASTQGRNECEYNQRNGILFEELSMRGSFELGACLLAVLKDAFHVVKNGQHHKDGYRPFVLEYALNRSILY